VQSTEAQKFRGGGSFRFDCVRTSHINPRGEIRPGNLTSTRNLNLLGKGQTGKDWNMGRRDLNWEFGERWAIVLLLRSLDLIILYQIRLMISVAVSAVKPDPTSILVVVEVELVVVEIVALQCLEVDLVPEHASDSPKAPDKLRSLLTAVGYDLESGSK